MSNMKFKHYLFFATLLKTWYLAESERFVIVLEKKKKNKLEPNLLLTYFIQAVDHLRGSSFLTKAGCGIRSFYYKKSFSIWTDL